MEEKKVIEKENNLIRNILFVLKKNLLLMLIIVLITTMLGIGYSYIKKPKYTASVRVKFSLDGNTTGTINEMRLYIDTIVDFCGQGVVVDRANAYYIEWLDNYKDDYVDHGKSVEDFYKDFSKPIVQGVENEIFNNYKRPNSNEEGTLKDESFVLASAISTQTVKGEDSATNWIYKVSYTDANQNDAYEKAYILVLAYKHELYWDDVLDGQDVERYFTGLLVNIESLGSDGVASDVSKTKITLVAAALGVALAFIVVYVKNLLDNTIKDKDELERITDAEVFGCINYVREKDKNGK